MSERKLSDEELEILRYINEHPTHLFDQDGYVIELATGKVSRVIDNGKSAEEAEVDDEEGRV